MASHSPDPPPYSPPQSTWRSYAPIGAGIGAGIFLITGTIVGFKRGIQRAAKPDTGLKVPSGPVVAVKPANNSDAFRVAVKALTYGTALCLTGSALVTAGVFMMLGVSNLQEFSDKMQEILPQKRQWLEGLIKPSLQNATALGNPSHKATEATESRPESRDPVTSGAEQDDSLAGLSATERKALRDLESMLFGKPNEEPTKK